MAACSLVNSSSFGLKLLSFIQLFEMPDPLLVSWYLYILFGGLKFTCDRLFSKDRFGILKEPDRFVVQVLPRDQDIYPATVIKVVKHMPRKMPDANSHRTYKKYCEKEFKNMKRATKDKMLEIDEKVYLDAVASAPLGVGGNYHAFLIIASTSLPILPRKMTRLASTGCVPLLAPRQANIVHTR